MESIKVCQPNLTTAQSNLAVLFVFQRSMQAHRRGALLVRDPPFQIVILGEPERMRRRVKDLCISPSKRATRVRSPDHVAITAIPRDPKTLA
jgi:hypothetical protein